MGARRLVDHFASSLRVELAGLVPGGPLTSHPTTARSAVMASASRKPKPGARRASWLSLIRINRQFRRHARMSRALPGWLPKSAGAKVLWAVGVVPHAMLGPQSYRYGQQPPKTLVEATTSSLTACGATPSPKPKDGGLSEVVLEVEVVVGGSTFFPVLNFWSGFSPLKI